MQGLAMAYSQDLDLEGERVSYQASAPIHTASLPVSSPNKTVRHHNHILPTFSFLSHGRLWLLTRSPFELVSDITQSIKIGTSPEDNVNGVAENCNVLTFSHLFAFDH